MSSGCPSPHHKPQFTQTATNPEEGELFASMAKLFQRVGLHLPPSGPQFTQSRARDPPQG